MLLLAPKQISLFSEKNELKLAAHSEYDEIRKGFVTSISTKKCPKFTIRICIPLSGMKLFY